MEDGFLLLVVLSVPRLAVNAAPYKDRHRRNFCKGAILICCRRGEKRVAIGSHLN
jgi:hypothetical protein